jgi:membrane-bound lytic murein transglycosylase D
MRRPDKLTILALLFLWAASNLNAGGNLKKIGQFVVTSLDTTSVWTSYLEPDTFSTRMFDEKFNDLINSWYINNIFLPGNVRDDFTLHPHINLSDSALISRLQKAESAVRLSYNPLVRDFIEMYVTRKPYQVEIMLGLTAFYFPIFEEILDKYELPYELKYLAIIESALNPRALSRAGAVGLWQFMYGTAKNLGLEITTFVDERRDIYKSTDAAARYLKQLYDIYKDWHLVIAAYNCGPGNVNKAINRAGGKTDYWQIYYGLPRETRSYVPAYIGATYVMNYYREHQLTPQWPSISLKTDTIIINHYLNLKQVADNLAIDLEALRDLNPMYRRDVIPGTPEKGYPLMIPVELVPVYIEKADTIYRHERDTFFPGNTIVLPQAMKYDGGDDFNYEGKVKITYTVKSGDNPGYIADWFDVSVTDLKRWNRISRNLIRVGQKLSIYVPENKTDYYRRINNLSFSAKQSMSGKTVPVNTIAEETPATSGLIADGSAQEFEYYTVRKGDNLWSIAQKYPGISNEDIMRLNNITNAKSLQAGQKLKIKPKS